jgi:hypothetical protein
MFNTEASMKTYKDFTDDVNGQIVGGNYGQCWVTYQGRKQGSTGWPATKDEAEAHCNGVLERIKRECGELFSMIYPDKQGWQFHFSGV